MTYRLRYRAANEIGEGPWSDITYVRAAILPKAPPSPVISAFDASKIDLVLSRTSDNGGSAGGVSFRYNLYSNEGTDGSTFHAITAYDGSSMSYSAAAGASIGASS